MLRLRLAVVPLLLAGLVLVPWPHAARPAPAPEPLAAVAAAPEPVPAPSGPLPFALLARFGDARLRHPGPVRSVVFSPDGRTVATTTRTDPVVRFWDVSTGRLVRELRVNNLGDGMVAVGGVSADARHLLAVRYPYRDRSYSPDLDQDREWGILDAATGDLHVRGKLPRLVAPPVVSPDGTAIAGLAGNNGLAVWSFDPAAPPRVPVRSRDDHPLARPVEGPNRVAFSPDGGQIVMGWGSKLLVVPTDGRGPVRELVGQGGWGYSSVFWPRPDRILAGFERYLSVFDPVAGRSLTHTASHPLAWHARGAAAGGRVVCPGSGVNGLAAFDPDTLAPVRTYPHPAGYEPFAASADGKLLAVADGHAVRLLGAATGGSLHPDLDRLPAEPADRFEFSADGRRMLAAGGETARMWDLPNGRPLWSAAVGNSGFRAGPTRTALSPDGRWALTSSGYDARTVVRDADTGRVLSDGKWSKDKMMAGLDGPGRVWVRNHTTGDLVSHALPSGPAERTIPAPAQYTGFFTSADGRWVVATTREAVLLRDARAADGGWAEIESQRDVPGRACGHSAPSGTIPLQFSPCGRYLLTWRRGLHLWHGAEQPASGVRLTAMQHDSWWWPDGAFSPDGRRLLAVAPDQVLWATQGYVGSVRVWETATGGEAFRFDPPGGATGCAVTPDGKRLVVAHPDTTFSVWDYAALEARAVGAAAGAGDRLASRDPKAGLAAVHALAADPAAVAVLRDRFRPADPARVAQLIAELGDDEYRTREAAERALAALGGRAAAGLYRAATTSPSAEVRARAERLLKPLAGPDGATRLGAGRAVEALERAGTPAARELLSEWAKDGGPVLAAEAAAALARLAAR